MSAISYILPASLPLLSEEADHLPSTGCLGNNHAHRSCRMSIGVDKDKISGLLEGCLVQVLASNEWLEGRVLSLSVDQLRWRPRTRRWSIAACLDHLNRT